MINEEDLLGDEDVEAAPMPSSDDLKSISTLAERLAKLEEDQADLERQAKAKADEAKVVREVDLPTAMTTLGLEKFTLVGGKVVEVADLIAASITKANQPQAFDWLEKTSNDGIIKHEFKISFGKGEEAWAKKFAQDLAKRKKSLDVERKDYVAPQTLGAFVRDRIAAEKAGEVEEADLLPRDLFSVFELRYAKITDPAAKKPKKKGA